MIGLTAMLVLSCGDSSEPILSITSYRTYTEGPHVVTNEGTTYAFNFILQEDGWDLEKEIVNKAESIKILVDNPIFEPFSVDLRLDPEPVPTSYAQPSKITVVADIEGNFSALYSLLVAQGIIDEKGNWTYGDGHLVMLGDLFDRGPDVTPTFWLLYKLEAEAIEAGGYVHTVLGNHEIMIFDGDTRYINRKYKAQINDTGVGYPYLYSANTVLGQWLRSKPAVIRIGDLMLSHAGVSPDVLALDVSLQEINEIVREKILYEVSATGTPEYQTIFGTNGIFWYRGWVDDPPSIHVLDAILDKYQVKHLVIGHTIVPDIQASFDYKLVMADLRQPRDVNRSPVRALCIEGNNFYEINSLGERRPIESS